MRHAVIAAAAMCAAVPAAWAQDTSVTLSGYVKLDAIYSQFSEGEVTSDTVRDLYVPGAIPVGEDGDSADYLDMHAKETRLTLKTTTDFGEHQLGTYLEMDFIVNPGAGDERITNAYNPGLRRAFISYDNWTLGQDWSTFQNLVALPENLDFVSWPSDGTVFMRQALVRYSNGGLDVSLENPETTITQADGSRVEADQNTVPDLVARYTFKPGASAFSVAGIVRQLAADGAAGVDGDTLGYGLSLAGKLPIGARDDIRFTVTGGEGIGRYVALNAVNDVQIDDGDLEAFGVYAGYIAYRHVWSPMLRSTLTVSGFEADHDVALTGGGVTKSMRNASINLLYSPIEPLTFGVEYRHSTREVENGADGDLDRIQFSAKYQFSWSA